jgi:hypothetical protein
MTELTKNIMTPTIIEKTNLFLQNLEAGGPWKDELSKIISFEFIEPYTTIPIDIDSKIIQQNIINDLIEDNKRVSAKNSSNHYGFSQFLTQILKISPFAILFYFILRGRFKNK